MTATAAGSCNDKDIGSYSNGGGHRQQSTKDSSGRNGSGDSNGDGNNNNNNKGSDGGNGNSGDGGVPSQQTIIS
jgi:hypothetical protein